MTLSNMPKRIELPEGVTFVFENARGIDGWWSQLCKKFHHQQEEQIIEGEGFPPYVGQSIIAAINMAYQDGYRNALAAAAVHAGEPCAAQKEYGIDPADVIRALPIPAGPQQSNDKKADDRG